MNKSIIQRGVGKRVGYRIANATQTPDSHSAFSIARPTTSPTQDSNLGWSMVPSESKKAVYGRASSSALLPNKDLPPLDERTKDSLMEYAGAVFGEEGFVREAIVTRSVTI